MLSTIPFRMATSASCGRRPVGQGHVVVFGRLAGQRDNMRRLFHGPFPEIPGSVRILQQGADSLVEPPRPLGPPPAPPLHRIPVQPGLLRNRGIRQALGGPQDHGGPLDEMLQHMGPAG